VLSLGILAFRWVSLGWMVVLALTAGELRRPALAVGAIGGLVGWTGWLTLARPRPTWPVLWADLALAVAVNVIAGLVMPAASVGERPYFAFGYPMAAAVTWGAARGVGGGVAAGLVLGASLVVGQLINGIDLSGDRPVVLLDLAGGTLNFVLAGGAVGLVASLLERSASQLRRATEETIRPGSGRPGWPSASRWPARSTTRCSRPWPWSTSGAGSWPPAARSRPTRWPGWPRWPAARSGPCGR
jgi:hypothetical protein